ncbi:MAG: hypothetical protein LBL94_05475 [Prevotellaceae bacterium]|nr:hypothetical protein [Prevotellaceae bacterium]
MTAKEIKKMVAENSELRQRVAALQENVKQAKQQARETSMRLRPLTSSSPRSMPILAC